MLAVVPTTAVTVRQLPPEEYSRLASLPLAAHALPDPTYCAVVVAETPTGEIVGVWAAFTVIHLDGLWVAPAYRRVRRVAFLLLREMKAMLRRLHLLQSFTYVDDPSVLVLALKAGFTRVPGDLLFLDLTKESSCPPSR